jgi:hypothetical protein
MLLGLLAMTVSNGSSRFTDTVLAYLRAALTISGGFLGIFSLREELFSHEERIKNKAINKRVFLKAHILIFSALPIFFPIQKKKRAQDAQFKSTGNPALSILQQPNILDPGILLSLQPILRCVIYNSMKYRSIQQYLEETNTTEKEFSIKLGISQPFVNLLKRGERRPTPELAAKIESITGIPFRRLLFPEKQPTA